VAALAGQNHDHEQFLRHTMRHADLVYSLAGRLAPSRADIDDIVQETYLRAFRAWGRQPPDDTAAWLATICLNVGRDMRRRHARYQAMHTDAPVPDLPAATDTAQQALDRLSTGRVHAALMALPEPQRIAITLMDLCGFTAQQVAKITDAPRGTVLARVHRGRRRLALSMAEPAAPISDGEVRDET
jgi:RNA polymerase sigma-70 factor (ECF subfamily)